MQYRMSVLVAAAATTIGGAVVLGQAGATEKPMGAAQQGQSSQMDQPAQGQLTPQQFVDKVSSHQQAVIQASQKVASEAQDPQVKQFAQQLSKDVQKSNDDLKDIAKKKNLQVSSQLQPRDQQMVSQLQDKTGQQLDQQFTQQAQQGIQRAQQLYQQASTQIQDPDWKSYAQKQISQLQQEQQQLSQIQGPQQGAVPAGGQMGGEKSQDAGGQNRD